MNARSNSFAMALSAVLAFLTYTSLPAVLAIDEQDEPSDLEKLINMDDATRSAMDPLSLAEALLTATKNDDSVHYDDVKSGDDDDARNLRELGKGKRQNRRPQNNNQPDRDYGEPKCSGSRPRKCGCPREKQSDYRGKIRTTENGYTCRKWTMAADYPDSGLEGEGYCRNPDAVAGRAWCYVEANGDDVHWGFCDVPTCEDDMLPYTGDSTTGVNVNDPGCVDTELYYGVEHDIEDILDSISDDKDKAHFIGGFLRLAAHDMMDFDQHSDDPMGMDGCLDWNSPNNSGLSTIWNEHSALYKLHSTKYPRISRPDFWLMAANAIIHITSVGRELDLINTFYYGRHERDECLQAADRLPNTSNCQQVEGVFLERMGMRWTDAVAMLGAHTVGLGHSEFSGHHGMWVPNHKKAQTFDKAYYQELVSRSWSPRAASHDPTLTDWTTGSPTSANPKMMLNTDMCLFYDTENSSPCCSRTDLFKENGQSRCEANADRQCSVIGSDHPRWEAAQAVRKFLGGSSANDNNWHFYEAFTLAWFKATLNGRTHLKPIMNEC